VTTAGRVLTRPSDKGITAAQRSNDGLGVGLAVKVPWDDVAARRRLDAELVRRGLVASRAEAHDAVSAGRVTVAGAPALKPARMVAVDEALRLLSPPRRFVSRGGDKLDAALDVFRIDVTGRRALDAGASTGGFTDCLLQRGARQVVAVDVGHGQLHPKLRGDARVVVRERTNVRTLTAADIGGPVDVVVADLSFISLRTVLPALLAVATPGAHLVLLVKPQFEAGRAEVSRGRGVVRDDAVRARVRREVGDVLVGDGATIMGWMESPLRGADGNVEYFVHALAPPGAQTP
jgi:23S rRNA (cytidine1920-2'-O)/16S rRNA (cytidine1409-2'-O)-methyltransferase